MKRIITLFCLVSALGLYTGCDGPKQKYAEILSDFGGDGYVDRERSEEEIKSLNKKIDELRKEVDRTISARYDLGVYYKMLAVEYIELKMFGPALEALEQAITISPVSSTLHYY
ncbi:MAG: hypothetical protein JW760_14085, partial [Spirochaetales bacterium]|nr:hypothetical protein [Spirochaetales bacterium]